MDLNKLSYNLTDISNRLSVHLMVSPLDDIVKNAVDDLNEIIEELEEE